MSTFGEDLITSANEALAIAEGRAAPTRMFVPPSVDVAKVRTDLGLSQTAFAAKFGLAVGTVRDWEQGRRRPEGPALVLLRVIERQPDAVERALVAS